MLALPAEDGLLSIYLREEIFPQRMKGGNLRFSLDR